MAFYALQILCNMCCRLVVGAPEAETSAEQEGVTRGGHVYRCKVDREDCQEIPFHQRRGKLTLNLLLPTIVVLVVFRSVLFNVRFMYIFVAGHFLFRFSL